MCVWDSYDDLQKNYKVLYVAGGAAQNCARGAQVRLEPTSLPRPGCLSQATLTGCVLSDVRTQYVLPEGSTAYLGCVGSDSLADQLRAANDREGLQSAYQVVEDKPTGACAVVITGHNRCVAYCGSLSEPRSSLDGTD